MINKLILLSLYLAFLFTGCQPREEQSITAPLNTECTLSPGQSAAIADTNLTITLNSVVSDNRCPSEVECVASGEVTVSLSLQEANEAPTEATLQTFTDQDGRAPAGPFEGIQNSMETGDYVVNMVGVLPYPTNSTADIKAADYQVTFMVTQQ
jgi:hypothetical protein